MQRLRLTSIALAGALALLAFGALGCQREPNLDEPQREGLFLDLAGLEYNVYLTRQLNLQDPEDKGYFQGPEAPPGELYYGVFINVCNPGGDPLPSSSSFRMHDTQGNEFEPVDLPRENVFAYHATTVEPHQCNPVEGSPAASSPTGGALLLFRVPVSASENRPLELEIRPPAGGNEKITFELDI
jgi:hypothetical protein